MDSDPYSLFSGIIIQINNLNQTGLLVGIAIIVILLIASALISGSEIAFFSLSPQNIKDLSEHKNKRSKTVLYLLKNPENLLATILVANNFVNVAIVIFATYVTNPLIRFIENDTLTIIFQLVVVTFGLLIFGELMPKVYASRYPQKFATSMSIPLKIASRLFWPLSIILVKSTSVINKHLKKHRQNISMDELSQAIELASGDLNEEKDILEGIVNFSNIEVKAIMKPRMDIIALDYSESFTKVLSVIVETGLSRIPVFNKNIDNIKGVLYIKDLLPYLNSNKKDVFDWQKLIRPHYQIPETKKINDLMEDFQAKKLHMAIIIDEYGGTSGIVTMEDILEEIVGEITDESDSVLENFKEINDNTWEFIAKTLITDFCKIVDAEYEDFEEVRGESDTLAGLILELNGKIPIKNEEFLFQKYLFTVKAVDKKSIKKIEVKIIHTKDETETK